MFQKTPLPARSTGVAPTSTLSPTADAPTTPRGGAASPADRRPPGAPGSRSQPADFHVAVRARDASAILCMREAGLRPVQLDAQRRSPVDLLRADPPSQSSEAEGLLHALQGSLNPEAPPGYIKPALFHGSPWGFEILASGALVGGANDAKGGAQSLNGKVFFSGRTPLSPDSTQVRSTVRSKPRVYAKGNSSSSAAPQQRVQRHAYLAGVLDQLKTQPGGGLSGQQHLDLPHLEAIGPEIQRLLVSGQFLPARIVVTIPLDAPSSPSRPSHGMPDAPAPDAMPGIPQIMVMGADEPAFETHTLEGPALIQRYVAAAKAEKDQMEQQGKVPLLAALTGRVVPLVFGFEPIEGLKTHPIYRGSKQEDNSYLDTDHALSGLADGQGRLKEIEVARLQDLSTLLFACLAQNIALPADLVVRVKADGKDRQKAGYLAPEQLSAFKQQFQKALSPQVPAGTPDLGTWLQGMNLDELRELHRSLPA